MDWCWLCSSLFGSLFVKAIGSQAHSFYKSVESPVDDDSMALKDTSLEILNGGAA